MALIQTLVLMLASCLPGLPNAGDIQAPKHDVLRGAAICFERTGGFAGIAARFWIYPDGRVVGTREETLTISPDTVETFLRQIESLSTLSSNRPSKSLCMDCYTYRVIVATGTGIRTYAFEEPLPEKSNPMAKVTRDLRDLLFGLPWKWNSRLSLLS